MPALRAPAPRVVAAALVVGVAALLVGGALVAADDPGQPALTAGGVALLVGSAAALWWWRTTPIVAGLASGACTLAYGLAEQPDPPFPVAGIVALYGIARWTNRRLTWLAAGLVGLVMVLGVAFSGDSGPDDYYRNLLPGAAALVLGDQIRERARAEAARRSGLLDAAVRAERTRIARELHDVVAHHVSMVVVQAEAGAAAAEAAGDVTATRHLDEISASARGALHDLRLLLDVLREGDDGPGTAPQPGLGQLDALVERVRSAGVPVELVHDGTPRPLAATVDLSAYRIVQEALTNVIRHAGPVPTRVRLGWEPARLTIEVVDEGSRLSDDPAADAACGRGLVGIRERVALLGGDVVIGARDGGGFAVRASVPTDGIAPGPVDRSIPVVGP